MQKFSPDLGDHIRVVREAMGWSQGELGQKVNLSQKSVSKIETGETQNPQLNTILRICDALGIDLTELVYGPA